MSGTMARPTKYDPSFCETVIYGLHDGSGNIFYVGKSSNLKKRLAAYKGGRFHGNRALASKIREFGVNYIIIRINPPDIDEAEFEEITSRNGLVNIIVDRQQPLIFSRSHKPWIVPGVKCPSSQYLMFMRNAFGLSLLYIKASLAKMCDTARMMAERRFAKIMSGRPSIEKWEIGVAGR